MAYIKKNLTLFHVYNTRYTYTDVSTCEDDHDSQKNYCIQHFGTTQVIQYKRYQKRF